MDGAHVVEQLLNFVPSRLDFLDIEVRVEPDTVSSSADAQSYVAEAQRGFESFLGFVRGIPRLQLSLIFPLSGDTFFAGRRIFQSVIDVTAAMNELRERRDRNSDYSHEALKRSTRLGNSLPASSFSQIF